MRSQKRRGSKNRRRGRGSRRSRWGRENVCVSSPFSIFCVLNRAVCVCGGQRKRKYTHPHQLPSLGAEGVSCTHTDFYLHTCVVCKEEEEEEEEERRRDLAQENRMTGEEAHSLASPLRFFTFSRRQPQLTCTRACSCGSSLPFFLCM